MELTFLGITNKGELIPESLRVLHIILWKIIIIEFTRTGMEPGKTFRVRGIFAITMRRMQTRMNAFIFIHTLKIKTAAKHKRPAPKNEEVNGILFPLASFEGELLKWNEHWIKKCDEHDIPHNMRPKR